MAEIPEVGKKQLRGIAVWIKNLRQHKEAVMINTVRAVLIALAILFAPLSGAAAETMIFWYPGEAGSTREAQPILQEFFAYLGEHGVDLTGAYFNTVAEGAAYIGNKKPAVGILSFAAWTMQRSELPGASVIMATRPLPHGKTIERYVLVGTKTMSDKPATLYTSEPLTRAFITDHLFPELPANLTLTQTHSMLGKLKDMASGTLEGYALLTPMEAYTLGRLNSDWTAKITTRTKSKPVPTARVILIKPSYKEKNALIEALRRMNADPKAHAILEELRLVGFQQVGS